MKVFFVHSAYKEQGGEDSVVENEIELLQKHGDNVETLILHNKKNSFLNILLYPFNFISYFHIIRAIRRFQPDVVQLHNLHFKASYAAIWAAKRMKVPVVMTLHNHRLICPSGTLFHNNKMYMKSLHASFPWCAVKDKVYRNSFVLTFWVAFTVWLHKQLGTFKKVDRFITINNTSRELFLQSGLGLKKSQIVTKPHSIKGNTAAPSFNRNNHFLYIGRLSPEKGIAVLLKAFASNGLPLTIIGDGPLRDAVQAAQKQNPLINWLGYQKKQRIDEELQNCSALIVPSVCLEGMPLTIVEGFAAGTPVIASKLGAMENIVTHNANGLLFQPNSADGLNRQLVKWMQLSKTKKQEFGSHALQAYEEKYTSQKNLSAMLSIYQSVTKKQARVQPAYRTHPAVRQPAKENVLQVP